MTDKVETDHEYSREVLYDLIEKGQEGIEEMMELAKQSEHPRAFEVLATMIKNTAETTDRLLALHTTKKKLEVMDRPALENKSGDTNNIFIGSTTDLQRFLQNEKTVIEHDDTE